MDYLEFWNIIDWISIIVGFVLMAVWLMYITTIGGAIQSSAALCAPDAENCIATVAQLEKDWISGIYQQGFYFDDFNFKPEPATVEKFDQFHQQFEDLASHLSFLKLVIMVLMFVMIMRFFKVHKIKILRKSKLKKQMRKLKFFGFETIVTFLICFVVFEHVANYSSSFFPFVVLGFPCQPSS